MYFIHPFNKYKSIENNFLQDDLSANRKESHNSTKLRLSNCLQQPFYFYFLSSHFFLHQKIILVDPIQLMVKTQLFFLFFLVLEKKTNFKCPIE
jgi:hypothetical protein